MAHPSETHAAGDEVFHDRNLQAATKLEREHLCSLGYFQTHYHVSMLQLITRDKGGRHRQELWSPVVFAPLLGVISWAFAKGINR